MEKDQRDGMVQNPDGPAHLCFCVGPSEHLLGPDICKPDANAIIQIQLKDDGVSPSNKASPTLKTRGI